MLSVSLDIFSGRRNPSWTLSKKEEGELIERVVADPSLIAPVTAPTARGLGYRGYLVKAMKTETSKLKIPSRFRIGNLEDDKNRTSLWLLDTSEKPDTEVTDFLREYAHRSILTPVTAPREAVPKSGDVGDFEKNHCASNYLTSDTDFTFWNNSASIDLNNCYNFAANYRSDTFAQPGNESGHPFSAFTCSSLGTACNWDGWGSACQANNLAIALVIWPDPSYPDFHFYRLCANGHWCHKPGHTAARNYDNSGYYITNPQTCDRGPYTIFCAYYHANNDTMFVS